MEGNMNNQRKIIGHGLPLKNPRRAKIIEKNSQPLSMMFPSNVPSGSTMFPSTVPLRQMMSQSTIPLGPVMFPSTVPLGPVISPYTVPLAPPSVDSLTPTSFQIWNRSNSMNFGGNSSTDQAMATSSSSTSSSINNPNTLPQPILLSSNNDIGKGKGIMMDPSPMSDKNPIPVADAPVSGHDNTTSETNAQTGFQFNACSRTDPNMDEKKHRRTMSNRLSAERIRKKRAQYVSELERKLKNLEFRIAVQRPQISQDKEHVQFLQMEHLKRLNQILTDKKNGLMRIDASIAQNKEAVRIWRQQELIQQQKMMQTQQRHQQKKMQMQQKQHQHQQKIMQMQQQQHHRQQQLMQMQQQQQQRMPVWEAGLEGIINPNPSLNQSGWLDQQQMGYPNSIRGIYGVNPEEMNRLTLNQHVSMNQPTVNRLHQVVMNQPTTNRLNENVHMNQPTVNRLNQVVMNQPATNRLNEHVTMNQPIYNRLNQVIMNQSATNRLNEHVTINQPHAIEYRGTNGHERFIYNMFNNKHIIINQPVTNDHQYGSARALQNAHQMLINNNRLNQQVIMNQPAAVEHDSARIETNDGHELLMNSNMLNQQIPMNHQVLVNQSAAVVDYCAQTETNGGHELLVKGNWLNQQQVPMNQPVAMVYGVAPAETNNGGHELLILNSNRLNQQVPMNQSAAAEYGGSTNYHQLLMNYQPQPGQMMMVSTDWGMDLQMPNQLPRQMMAPPDNWDQLGTVQMLNPNSNMTINPNYQLDELEQFKNLNLNPPNLPN